MQPRQRQRAGGPTLKDKDSPPPGFAGKRLLCLREEVAQWQRNPYILSGFRPESKSYMACLQSLGYLHNQTGNIYSHGIAVPLMWVIGLILYRHAKEAYPSAGAHDWMVFSAHLTGMTIGYSLSAAFHTFGNHSEAAHSSWLRMDLLGIIVVIAGCFPPGLYYSFYCMDEGTKLAWMMVALCAQGVGAFFVLFVPKFRTPQWSTIRAAFYVLLGSSAFLPVLASTFFHGVSHSWVQSGAGYYLITAALYLAGAGLYAVRKISSLSTNDTPNTQVQTKWPESQWPGRLDIPPRSIRVFFQISSHHRHVLNDSWFRLYGYAVT
ncbi:hypothetical protein FH972_024024 [Carpinus fangiana]|uniref:Uncharacterized protein n=1 Tax=Carpinus fangiana TaxID=176857 RepID=A0A5N6KX91_9ROSI|nr:hypothetical protein FH972_024024 [Carpinus fangiana]